MKSSKADKRPLYCAYVQGQVLRDEPARTDADIPGLLKGGDYRLLERQRDCYTAGETGEKRHAGRLWGLEQRRAKQRCSGRAFLVATDPGFP